MGRTKFKWQASYFKIYRVGPQLEYTSIQSAIDEALSDLGTPNAQNFANAALIEIYDKGSAYAENITIYPGIHLKGVAPRQSGGIPITGNHTLAFSAGQAGQTREQNSLFIESLNFSATSGRIFTLGGSSAFELRLIDSAISKTGSTDGLEAILASNSASTSRVRIIDSVITYSDTQGVAGTSYGIRLQNSIQFEVFGGRSGLFGNNAGNATFVRLEGSSAFVFQSGAAFRSGGATSAFPTHIAAFGPYVFEIASSSAGVILQNITVTNTFTAGSLLNYVAAGTARVLNCHVGLQGVSSKLCNGASGNFIYSNLSIESTSGEGRNNVDAGINVIQINEGARFKISGSERAFRVGLGGYASIQAAVNAAAASSASEKVVVIPPGSYAEDVTVPLGIRILGESKVRGGPSPAVSIRSITLDPSTGSGETIIENIALSRSGTSSYVFRTVGANVLNVSLVNCALNCQETGTTDSLIELQNTNASSLVIFKNCSFIFQSDNASHPLLDALHNFIIIDSLRTHGNPDFINILLNNTSGSVGNIFRLAANVTGELIQISISAGAGNNRAAELNNNSVLRLRSCKIAATNLADTQNEMFLYQGSGSIEVIASQVNFSDDADEGLLARDSGTRATASLTVDSSNSFDVGDAVVVNGVSFVYNVDWVPGVDASATAANIRTAINSSPNPSVQGVVYARNSGSTITIYSRKNGTSQNAPGNTLSVVDGGSTSFTGVSTFSGGTNGAGGNFRYGASVFSGENKLDAAITTTAFSTSVTAL